MVQLEPDLEGTGMPWRNSRAVWKCAFPTAGRWLPPVMSPKVHNFRTGQDVLVLGLGMDDYLGSQTAVPKRTEMVHAVELRLATAGGEKSATKD